MVGCVRLIQFELVCAVHYTLVRFGRRRSVHRYCLGDLQAAFLLLVAVRDRRCRASALAHRYRLVVVVYRYVVAFYVNVGIVRPGNFRNQVILYRQVVQRDSRIARRYSDRDCARSRRAVRSVVLVVCLALYVERVALRYRRSIRRHYTLLQRQAADILVVRERCSARSFDLVRSLLPGRYYYCSAVLSGNQGRRIFFNPVGPRFEVDVRYDCLCKCCVVFIECNCYRVQRRGPALRTVYRIVYLECIRVVNQVLVRGRRCRTVHLDSLRDLQPALVLRICIT